jgi:HD superfamily phosphohydrolase
MQNIKTKIINDPVHGFISIPDNILLKIIDHPYFQRLRRIKQLGLTDWVYPGAVHTRFGHALGSMFLMHQSIISLSQKGHKISKEEETAALAAILLHDIGHGPFSHALEHSLVSKLTHEEITSFFLKDLINQLGEPMDLALEIFEGNYHRDFLHQLISSQLDVDRMDYLRRDSFFTGVSEGVIGNQRIVKMFNIVDDKIVVEHKGIHSIENFINSRRIMYLQVYLHKTVLAAEQLLIKILKRASELFMSGVNLFASPSLKYFLGKTVSVKEFENGEAIAHFANLDDTDILNSIKVWANSEDKVLALLSKSLIGRRLYKTEISDIEIDLSKLEDLRKRAVEFYNVDKELGDYLVFSGKSVTEYFNPNNKIPILLKDGSLANITEVSDQFKNINNPIERHFICYPKEM